jgi:murein DD-endopeptidase MepM/ murein hydrolase activator NlpD
MTVSAALATVIAVPVALGAGLALAAAVPEPVTRPAVTVDHPRPVAAAPGPLAVALPPLPPLPPGSSPTAPRRPSPSPGAPHPSSRDQTGRGGYGWPLSPRPNVLRPFRPGPFRWSAGHRGVDLSARAGQPVLAAAAGRVTFTGPIAGRPVVVVVHLDGLRTTYEPVDPAVRVGDVVAQGAMLGQLAAAGSHCDPTCLHWGALRGADYLDPLSLLPGRRPVVLLPLTGRPPG